MKARLIKLSVQRPRSVAVRLVSLFAAILPAAGLVVGAAPSSSAATITPPDMQLLVPTSDISIGTNSTTGDRQLQFTHVTWDAGTGPFEIDPTYNAATGLPALPRRSTTVQALVAGSSTTPCRWR